MKNFKILLLAALCITLLNSCETEDISEIEATELQLQQDLGNIIAKEGDDEEAPIGDDDESSDEND